MPTSTRSNPSFSTFLTVAFFAAGFFAAGFFAAVFFSTGATIFSITSSEILAITWLFSISGAFVFTLE
ncbi:MAG: hypothetical protein E7366_05595 [Clostridiales bacterium]|nr:hypothetical protein [Clostridiales bacterium]